LNAPSTLSAAARVPRLPGLLSVERLGNGLTVALVDNPQAPLVSTVLCYRAGTRDEPAGHGGIAHFLEHMMFKGSARFGPGEVDRRTQELGGSNNAFTSHDATTYYFNFAADRWPLALEIEADRMAGLTLEPREVEAERRVILEEIAMYEDDPWDALNLHVERTFFDGHPYGRPVLGTRDELLATGPDELAAFHRARYRPDTAVLVVAGDLAGLNGPKGRSGAAGCRTEAVRRDGAKRVAERVREIFGDLPGGGPARPEAPVVPPPDRCVRIERRRGEMARLLMALPGPAASDPGFAAARLLASVLGSGRGSRLYRALVDEGQLCGWAAAGLSEALDPTSLTVVTEALPGVEPARVEEVVLALLTDLASRPPASEEVERAREVLLADWSFGHERISQQALSLASDLALLERGWSERTLEAIAMLGPEDVARAAAERLDPERGAVLGWSLPERSASAAPEEGR
jgi:zinc protease